MNTVDIKNTRYYLCLCIALIVLSVSSTTIAEDEERRDPRAFFFTQSFGDLPEELQTAKEEGKQGLLLFFEAEGCPYCRVMLKQVFSKKQVQDWYQQRFLSIAVDIHGDVDIKDFDGIVLPLKVFAQHRKVFTTPTMSFIDLNGHEIYRHLGMVKDPEEFLAMGEYIVDGHYFDTEYRVFAEKRGLNKQQKSLVTPAHESGISGEQK
jgi:thioredoxin-related protein